MADAYSRFIAENLPVRPVPLIPEIRLHIAGPESGISRIAVDSPYFAYPWAGGIALARYLLDNPGLVAGRRLIDLGAGSGLVGIAAAMCGGVVLCAETDAAGAAAIRLNAALNGVSLEVTSRDLTAGPPPQADIVVGGDVFYSAKVARRVLGFLERCTAAGLEVLVGDPQRRDLPVTRLRKLAGYAVPDFGGGQKLVETGIYALVQGSRARGALAPVENSNQKEPLKHSGKIF